MVEGATIFGWGQVVFLAASLPLAAIAAWGYRRAPIGRAIASLPLVSLGLLVSASAELHGLGQPGAQIVWQLGSALGVLGLAWFAVALLRLVSGRRRVGR